ncbi:MAG: heme-binding protein [Hyphomonas sp.]|uniref:GlcG/HbpS family heme-binding protein n=1 Tax=Hyphomonas sp. TaxID=87 RepID=UPI003528AA32
MLSRVFAATVILATACASAEAQRAQPTLDLATAQTIVTACVAHAAAHDYGVAVAVFDQHGNLKAFAHMDTADAAVRDVAQWKGKSAATYGFTTAETAKWGGNAPNLAVWRGGLPIRLESGELIGGVGVSGAPSEFDEECGNTGIAAAGLPKAEIVE